MGDENRIGKPTPARAPVAASRAVRPIAFYLPQFHPIEENDRAWGRGFTEWTNVARARPLFPGHQQPQLPADLGYYDLRVPEVMEQQAALARSFGVEGFCFYHYWFDGKRLLEMPIERMLASGRPDFPFCLCWANENWTRSWDGGDRSVVCAQSYSAADDLAHIRYLLPFFHDPRYLRVDGAPVFLVYRTELHPDIARAADLWRREAIRSGLPGLHLARVENFEPFLDPASHGFDAGVEFSPARRLRGGRVSKRRPLLHKLRRLARRVGLHESVHLRHHLLSMCDTAELAMALPPSAYPRYRCVTPSWDNTPRRPEGATVFLEATPDLFETWTRAMAVHAREHGPGDAPLLFVNAWNEWAEGCHLEPCQQWGTAWLEAFRRGLGPT